MPNLTFNDGFYHASRARDIAVGNGSANNNVLVEINALQIAVDDAARLGELSVSVGIVGGEFGSVMTIADNYIGVGSSSHYDAWIDIIGAQKLNPAETSLLRASSISMDRVISYFSRLGYSIERERGGTIPPIQGTDNRIQWKIIW